jgi:hypothetical protein
MIKKMLLLAAVMILLVCNGVFASRTEWFDFDMFGHIRMLLNFDVTMFEEVIPFDLDGVQVQYNEEYTTIARGLRIGTYRLSSNNTDVVMVVSHTPLKLRNNEVNENNVINYRLYVMTEIGNPGFHSTRGDKIELTGNLLSDGGMISLIDKYMYVTMDEGSRSETERVLAALASGTYESTITFEIWVAR